MIDRSQIEYWRAFIRRNQEHIDQIMDYFHAEKIEAAQGEELLLLLAGMSAGIRGVSITGNWSEPVARGWQLGAAHGDGS